MHRNNHLILYVVLGMTAVASFQMAKHWHIAIPVGDGIRTVFRADSGLHSLKNMTDDRNHQAAGECFVGLSAVVERIQAVGHEDRTQEIEGFSRSVDIACLKTITPRIQILVGEANAAEWRQALMSRLAQLDLTEAISLASRQTSSNERLKALQLVVDTWARTDPINAAKWLLRLADGHIQLQLAPLVTTQLEAVSAQAAADFVTALPAGPQQEELLNPLLYRWGSSNSGNAISWARQLEEGPTKDRSLMQLAHRWAELDLPGALAYAQGPSASETPLLTALTSEWTRRDPRAAIDWAMGLTDAQVQSRILPNLTALWTESTPAEAARFVASLPPGAVQTESAVAVASGWAKQDPVAAAQWASEFPSGEMQDQAYLQVMSAWGGDDDGAVAADWIATLQPSSARDAAFGALVGVIAQRNPATAFMLADNISSEGLRKQRLQQIAGRWLAVDPNAARAALSSAGFSLESVEHL